MLEQVGLVDAARKRAGGYSMGMRQRLGLAAAMLGDPQVLILDEPANGLDPEGIRWLRGFLRHVSSQGKTVLVSSHMLQEVEQTVDDIVIIANGRLVEQGAMSDLHGAGSSLVRTTDPEALLAALRPVDVAGTLQPDGSLLATSCGPAAHRRRRAGRRTAGPRAAPGLDRPRVALLLADRGPGSCRCRPQSAPADGSES